MGKYIEVRDFVLCIMCNWMDDGSTYNHKANFDDFGAKYADVLKCQNEELSVDITGFLEEKTNGFKKSRCLQVLWEMEEAHQEATHNRKQVVMAAVASGWSVTGETAPVPDLGKFGVLTKSEEYFAQLYGSDYESTFDWDAAFERLFGADFDRYYNKAVAMLQEKMNAPVGDAAQASTDSPTSSSDEADGAASDSQKPQQAAASDSSQKPKHDEAKGFQGCIIYKDKARLLEELHRLIEGKKGKDVAMVIAACIELGYIRKPTFAQIGQEFGGVGDKSGYNRYMQQQDGTDWVWLERLEVDGMKQHLKQHLSK